jgi:hypothetical protein
LPICALIYLWWTVRRESKALRDAINKVDKLRARNPAGPTRGLSSSQYNELADIFSESPSLKSPWNAFASLTVVRRGHEGDDQFWSAESAEAAFTDDAVLEGRLNRSFYNSLAGIVTGTGLMFTFLAILVALVDVRIDTQTNQIEGLPLLIEGLSGKFVSSISALFSATVFLIFEKPLMHRLSKARLRLVASIDSLMPRLSTDRRLRTMANVSGNALHSGRARDR